MAIASGSYTIGGTSPNYATIQLFEDDLATTLTGVVEGKIREGDYYESVTVGGVTATAANYIKFTYDTDAFHSPHGTLGLRSGVQLHGKTSSPTDNHLFNSTQDHVRFVGLNFNRWKGVSTEAIRIGADGNYVEQCLFWGSCNINADLVDFVNRYSGL